MVDEKALLRTEKDRIDRTCEVWIDDEERREERKGKLHTLIHKQALLTEYSECSNNRGLGS